MKINQLLLQNIPSVWTKQRLSDISILIKDGTHGTHPRISSGIPLLSAKNITDRGEVFWDDSDSRISEIEYESIHRSYELESFDLLITIVGSLGRRALVQPNTRFTIQRSVAVIRCNSKFITPGYLYHFTGTDYFQNQFILRSNSTAQAGLYLGELANIEVAIPPIPEQHCITEILDTVDETIALTTSLIAKLKQIRAGLLHDLLTRGLDEDGKLRDAIAHPEQFKDSPLGRIPKDWETFQLSEVVPRAEYGISVSLDDEVGIPVLRMNNLKNAEVDLTDLKKSSSTQAANLLLQAFDVLFNRTNSIEHVGRTAIWRGQVSPASFASYLVRLIPEPSKLIPEYLNIWLNLPTTQLLIRRYATPGVHQVNINPTNLRKVSITLPVKILEQKQIVESVAVNDSRVRSEEAYLDKLKLQKKGLMYDLLTGKVRVNQI